MERYSLFYKNKLVGAVVPQHSDFPNLWGRLAYHHSLLEQTPDIIRLTRFLELNCQSTRLIDVEHEQDVSKELKAVNNEMNQYLDFVDTDDWCLVDEKGFKNPILAPILRHDEEIVWRWNPSGKRQVDRELVPIYFYSKTKAYYEFSNFSPHGFELESSFWPTVEHYFQAQKFPTRPEYQKKIRLAPLPKDAKALGRSRKVPLREDWEAAKEDIMRYALRAKFTTNLALRQLLLETKDKELAENAPSDYYWGCGRAGTGKNRLGFLLMELRSEWRRKKLSK